MFGYVRPALEKLSDEEQKRYQALYCGLCHTLGRRYGISSRMILNYDFTFLAALLSQGVSLEERRCIVHPIHRRPTACTDEAMTLAADCSVILAYWQLSDHVADSTGSKRRTYQAARLMLKGAYGQAAAVRPRFDAATRQELGRLGQLEAARCPTLDEPADTFATLLQGVAAEVTDVVGRRVLAQFLYHLGRWIYLVDALDDLQDDAVSGNYNPILLRFQLKDGVLTPEARHMVVSTLDASIRQMAAAYELWDFGVWSPIIQATVYQGLYQVGNAVLEGTFHSSDNWRAVRAKKEQL